jgi:ATP-dependent DNA helicase RecG
MTKGSFVRVSDSDRRLSAYEVQVMLSSRGSHGTTSKPCPGATIEDLVPAVVDALVARLRTTPSCAARRSSSPARNGGDAVSLAGLLTAGMSPPRSEDRISSFSVTFPNHTLLSEDTVRWITA